MCFTYIHHFLLGIFFFAKSSLDFFFFGGGDQLYTLINAL